MGGAGEIRLEKVFMNGLSLLHMGRVEAWISSDVSDRQTEARYDGC